MIADKISNQFDIWGNTVNIASRMESASEPRKIHISEQTQQFLNNDIKIFPRTEVKLKNKGTVNSFYIDNI